MLAALDVCYGATAGAAVSCVLFASFPDGAEARSLVVQVPHVEGYEPGAFYKRELPCLLAALAVAATPLDAVLIDGYVWLSKEGRKGLGAHLFEALGGATPVVGVAKTPFAGSTFAQHVLRGTSKHPLYVTAAGMPVTEAAARVASMHGEHRVPTLLRRADRLCRDAMRHAS